MKTRPFCAGKVQDAAGACRQGGGFPGGPPDPPPLPPDLARPWHFRTSTLVLAFCCVGPLALPLVWWRPRTTSALKTGLTFAILALTWLLYEVMLKSLQTIGDFYQLWKTI